jgi:hypothetical protein
MKKIISLVSVLALVCFTSMVFAADAPATNPEGTKKEAPKAEMGKENMVWGKIVKIDKEKNEITLKSHKGMKTIVVKPEDMANLKKGEEVKVTLESGTMNAEKIEMKKAKKSGMKMKKEMKEEAPATPPAKPAE